MVISPEITEPNATPAERAALYILEAFLVCQLNQEGYEDLRHVQATLMKEENIADGQRGKTLASTASKT